MELKLLRVREASGEYLLNPEEIYCSMKSETQADRECFWVLHLNTKNQVIEKELVSMGTGNAALVSPREVFRKAITNGAMAIATVHNHPSGGLEHSKEDREMWDRLRKAGDILGIKVLDNLVISSRGFYSEKEGRQR